MIAERATWVGRLAEISGPSHVTDDPARLASYSACGIVPQAAIQPASTEEVAAIVQFAASEHLAIVPCGARTKLGMGLSPQRYDLAVDLTRMQQVISFDPGDLTLSVEAGIPFCSLQTVLAEHNQFLPLAPPYAPRATVGGTIASGVDGPLRQLYGTARDFVLGMEFVTGQGILAKSGGRVVKNVTGYDLHKLIIGAMGTLGIITKVNFRTFPAPAGSRIVIASFDSVHDMLGLRRRIAEAPLRPLAVDFLSPAAHPILSAPAAAQVDPRPIPTAAFQPGAWALATAFAGNEAETARYERELREMAETHGASATITLAETDARAAFSRYREWIPLVLELYPAAVILKVGILPARMEAILAVVAKVAEEQALPWAAIGRGVGVIYAALLAESVAEETGRSVAAVAKTIQSACAAAGGHGTIPWCPDRWKRFLDVWGPENPAAEYMQKMKGVFDPNGVLSPGRFLAGI